MRSPMNAPPPSRGPSQTPEGLQTLTAWTWRLLVVAAGAIALGWVFLRLSIITVPVFVSLLAASALWPAVVPLRSRGVPDALASLLVITLVALVMLGTALLLGPSVVDQAGDLEESVRAGVNDLPNALGGLGIDEVDIERAVDGASDALRDNANAIGLGLFEAALVAVNLVAGFLLGIVILFFFLKDGPSLWSSVLSLFPHESREEVDHAARGAFTTMSRYVRGQAVVALVDAVGIGLAMVIIGVPLALPVAVLTFVLAFIPFLGAIISGFVAVCVALATGGTTDALLVLGAVIVVQQVESNVLYPIIVGRAVALHPVVILVGLGAGASLGGLVGAIVAVPFAAAVTGAMAGRREWRADRAPPAPDEPVPPELATSTG